MKNPTINPIILMTLISIGLLSGCGVVSRMSPTSKELELTSIPNGVQVTISGGKSGATPCVLSVPNMEAITVATAFKSGYRSETVWVNWRQQAAKSGKQLASTGQHITAVHRFNLSRAPAREKVRKTDAGLVYLEDLDVRGMLAAGVRGVEEFVAVRMLITGKHIELTGGVFWPGTKDPFTGKCIMEDPDPKSQSRIKMSFKDGIPHGETITYHSNGKIMTKLAYHHGWPEGKVEQWHSNGEKGLEIFVANRTVESLKMWDIHGNPIPVEKPTN